MQNVVPNIWCNRNAEEVGQFYADAFPGATAQVEYRYPTEDLLDFQLEFAGLPLVVAVTIGDTKLSLINAGDEFAPNPSISFMLNFDPLSFGGDEAAARRALDELWGKLSDGGFIMMPLAEYPHSKHYGWVSDRYGVSWQLMLTDPSGEPRPFLIPALMYCGPAQNKATEAVDHYVSIFDDARLGNRYFYPEATGPVTTKSVMFSDFQIKGEWLIAMDSGVDQPFTFSNGVSLEVRCEDQDEIDRYWDALSAVPEAEACGWLADFAGVAWQIVPANMDELMQRPGAYARMLEMKKLIIADF